MRKATRCLLCMTLVLCMLLTACGKAETTKQPLEQTTESNETRVFVDSAGREVEVPENITRIAASGSMAQIILYSLVPDKLVGLADEWDEEALQYIDSRYAELPVFGAFYGKGDLNMESVLLADPQIIIDVGEPKETIAEDMDKIQSQIGIPTVTIEAHFDTMADAYRMLGDLLRVQDEAEKRARYLEEVLTDCKEILDSVGSDKAKLLYCVGEDGLSVIAKGAYQGELIDRVSDNAAVVDEPSSKGSGNEVSMEQILLWDPDVIFFAPGSVFDTVANDETWMQLSAISNGSYYAVPEGIYNWMGFPPSVQRYLGMMWSCKVLYPDRFSLDLKSRVTEFYDLFFHLSLSDEQYSALVH